MILRKLSITAVVAMAITACGESGTTDTTNAATETAAAVSTEAATASVATGAVVTVEVEESSATAEKPSISTTRSVQVTATVAAIDHETRVVTLVRDDGQSVTFTAGEDARNLDQVAVGDLVNADYVENITIQVMAADNVEPAQAVLVAAGRSEEGEMPAMAAIETKVDVSTVEEINIENNTFKLKNVDGQITEFTAKNPDNLKKAVVGDVVVISLTQAIGISVEKSTAE